MTTAEKAKEIEEKLNRQNLTSEEKARKKLDLHYQNLSEETIDKNTKSCPNCNLSIIHAGGCNKMVLILLNINFYSIFNNSCVNWNISLIEMCILLYSVLL